MGGFIPKVYGGTTLDLQERGWYLFHFDPAIGWVPFRNGSGPQLIQGI